MVLFPWPCLGISFISCWRLEPNSVLLFFPMNIYMQSACTTSSSSSPKIDREIHACLPACHFWFDWLLADTAAAEFWTIWHIHFVQGFTELCEQFFVGKMLYKVSQIVGFWSKLDLPIHPSSWERSKVLWIHYIYTDYPSTALLIHPSDR